MILIFDDTVSDQLFPALSSYFTANVSNLIIGIVSGAISGLIIALITAGYVYRYNSDSAYYDALENVIREMKGNVDKLQNFESDLQGLIYKIKAGEHAWLPKYAGPRPDARSRYLYAYFDVKAFDSFNLQGYTTRMLEGRFESLSLFYNHCGNFNVESQRVEELINWDLEKYFVIDKPMFNTAVPMRERMLNDSFQRYCMGIKDAYDKFRPDDKNGLIELYWKYPWFVGESVREIKFYRERIYPRDSAEAESSP